MGISFSGLATGLDTKSIVDQLLQLDARPKTKLEWNKSLWESRKSTWGDLNTRLTSLRSFADTLKSPASWTIFSGINSTDPTKVTGSSSGPKPATGTYAVEVAQLATTEKWTAASNLPAATAGVRETGAWYEAVGDVVEGTDLVRLVTRPDGTATGLNTNSTMTMSWEKDGNTYSSTFLVQAASTMDDLVAWANTQLPGATVSLQASGSLRVESAAGTDEEITSLSFSARNSGGTVLNAFAGTPGATSSMTTAATDGGAPAADTLQFTQGANTWYVNVAQGDTEGDLVNKINNTPGIGLVATLNAGKLELTAKDSGAGASFTTSSTGGTAALLGLAETTAGVDANFTVAGTAYTRSKNTGITDVLKDVSLDLTGVTAGPVSITVGEAAATTDEMKARIKDFVNQYNSILDFVASKTGESKVLNPKNLSEYLQGSMSRDYGFSSVAFDLRKSMTDIVTGLPGGSMMLADIGITTAGGTTGKLVIDDAKLTNALNTDSAAVAKIFNQAGDGVGSKDDEGIARRISMVVGELVQSVNGRVDSAIRGASDQMKNLQTSIDRFTDRLNVKRKYYERMFSTLETNIGKMQSQGSWLSGQLAGLQ